MPFLSCTPVSKIIDGKLDGFRTSYLVPADDGLTSRYIFQFKRSEPMIEIELNIWRRQIGPDYVLIGNKHNDYRIDREKQRTSDYTGVEGVETEDACVTESMGPICDRTKEHLGVSDAYVIAVRRFLLKAARSLQEGEEPPGNIRYGDEDASGEIDCTDITIPIDEPDHRSAQRSG